MAYVQRFLNDENGEYLLLAAFWFWNKPIYISLIPFATFSLFHTRMSHRYTYQLTADKQSSRLCTPDFPSACTE